MKWWDHGWLPWPLVGLGGPCRGFQSWPRAGGRGSGGCTSLVWHASHIPAGHTDHQQKAPLHSHSNNHHSQFQNYTVVSVWVINEWKEATLSLSIKPYNTIYPVMYVPGSCSGWNRWYQRWLELGGQPRTVPTRLAREWRRSMSDCSMEEREGKRKIQVLT